MKYKKLFISLSVVAGFLLFCIILMFTLFRVHSVKLNFKNQTSKFNAEAETDIVNSSGVSFSTPVFVVNKTKMKENLEKRNPYLKVINIETVFPNKLVIHCAEREETYCIKISENLYYICDDEFKVLTSYDSQSMHREYQSDKGNATVLSGLSVKNKNANIGDFLTFESDGEIASNLITAMAYNNRTISDFRAMFKEVRISYERDFYTRLHEAVIYLTTFDNFEIKLELGRCNLIEKVNLMLALIPQSYNHYDDRLIISINPENIQEVNAYYKNISEN